MPVKYLVFNIISIVFQYLFVVLIYYFLFKVIHVAYNDLRIAGKQTQSESNETRFTPARLQVLDNGNLRLSKKVFSLGETTIIGRSADSDIVLDDTFISHEHACITNYRQSYWLTDLQSTNRTYINGRPVAEEVELAAGDIIKIGAVTLKFER